MFDLSGTVVSSRHSVRFVRSAVNSRDGVRFVTPVVSSRPIVFDLAGL